ncbi:hypothetical protein YC2023_024144 [Brassica napus]
MVGTVVGKPPSVSISLLPLSTSSRTSTSHVFPLVNPKSLELIFVTERKSEEKDKNRLVFENIHISAGSTISSALASACEWQMAQQGCLSLCRISAFLTGTITPPPPSLLGQENHA